MAYSAETLKLLEDEYQPILSGLQRLALDCITHGQRTANKDIQEHLMRGAGRRISVIGRAIANIYTAFPPETVRRVPADALSDVQINLQAFVFNLYGTFDNFAWAFVFQHGLERTIGRNKTGMFYTDTQRYLPPPLRAYLVKPETRQWIDSYLKEYRDSLAHRIPLYVPPFIVNDAEGARFRELEEEKLLCIRAMNWPRLDEIYAEQDSLGSPCYTFHGAFSGPNPPRPILIHPQVLADAKGLVQFGDLFLSHWHQRA